jgi:hypothetical protein
MTSLVVRLARAVAVFITALIVSAVRLAVRPAAVSALGRLAVGTTAAIAVTPFAASAPIIRLFIALIGAALAPVIRLIIIPLMAAPPIVIIIILVRHLVLLQRLRLLIWFAVWGKNDFTPVRSTS